MLLAIAFLQVAVAERTGAFASPRVTESSGVVASRRHPGLLWTNNDSGDEAILYATDVTGADRGYVRIPGITPVDAEDLAEGPCPAAAARCLYVADTGDNREDRRWVSVYAVPEPAPPAGSVATPQTTAPPARLRVRYPDRPRDVEAAFVTGAGTVYLVSKGRGGTVVVYRLLRAAWQDSGVVTAEVVQRIPLDAGPFKGRAVTGAALLPDSSRVAIRTYRSIVFFQLRPDGTLAPTGHACDLRIKEPLGEAVAYLDARRLVITSEASWGKPGPIHVVTCPD